MTRWTMPDIHHPRGGDGLGGINCAPKKYMFKSELQVPVNGT